jgi:hypothetical protein
MRRRSLGECHDQKIRFAAIGLDHRHILGQVGSMLRAGAECVGFYADNDDLVQKFSETFPAIPRVADRRRILEDDSIHMVVSAAIPSQRAALGIEAMRHGKDYMVDKPGFTTLGQLDEVRRFSVRPPASIRSASPNGSRCRRRQKRPNWCRRAPSGRWCRP